MRLKTETTVGIFIVLAIGIFLYMSFQIGTFRFDSMKYNEYTVYFTDVSGLSKKGDVKIAGVKVGWIDNVSLINDGQQVRVDLMVLKKYLLHSDAHGVVRQDGLLGSKFLELVPGDPILPILPQGSVLARPSEEPVAIDQLMHKFRSIATNVESITNSLRDAVGTPERSAQLQDTLDYITHATRSIASFSESFDQIVKRNEHTIDSIMQEFRSVLSDLRDRLPNVDRSVERASVALEDALAPIRDVGGKINRGEGLLGQLLSKDDTTFDDLRTSIQSVKKYFSKMDRISLVVDAWTETMFSQAEHMFHRDMKGYANVRVHPVEDYFYLAGLVATRKGPVDRTETYTKWFDERGVEILPSEAVARLGYTQFPSFSTVKTLHRNKFFFNLQLGKIYGNVAIRAGIFESTGGFAVDFNVPIGKKLRWVSTVEVYDFYGMNRVWDVLPHVKWLNKLYFTPNLYLVIGADDFISKQNKSAFTGIGLRFCDDDLKYIASKAGGFATSLGTSQAGSGDVAG